MGLNDWPLLLVGTQGLQHCTPVAMPCPLRDCESVVLQVNELIEGEHDHDSAPAYHSMNLKPCSLPTFVYKYAADEL